MRQDFEPKTGVHFSAILLRPRETGRLRPKTAGFSGYVEAGVEHRRRAGVNPVGDCVMSHGVARRAVIAAWGAFALVAAIANRDALAQRLAVGDIRVDVSPLRANGGDPTATWVEQELPRQLAEALSGHLAQKDGALVVRVDSLTLGPLKDSRAWDNISGVATIGGIERPVRATSRYWASAVDQAMIVRSNHARVSAAVQALAFWIARDL
jgi:hypothetical protein